MNYLTIILPIIITALVMNYQLRLTVNLNFRQLLCFRIIARQQVPIAYLQFIGCFRRFYVNERRYNLAYPMGDILKQIDVEDCDVS